MSALGYQYNSSVSAVTQPPSSKNSMLFFDSFGDYAVGGSGNYYYFSDAVGGDADDGVVTLPTAGTPYLDINSGVGGAGFAKTLAPTPIPAATGGLDHVHYLVYRNGSIALPDDGREFVYEARVAAQTQAGTVPAALADGVTNAGDDIRIAGSAINMLDFASWCVFDIFFSNETIYAFVERLPFGKPSFGGAGPDYHAYSHAIPIAKRNKASPLTQFDTVAIALNRKESTAKYYVNNELKFVYKDFGIPLDRKYRILDHGGPATKVDLQQINVGFGTFTLLDMANPVYESLPQALSVATYTGATVEDSINPNRPLVQLGLDAQYLDPQRTVAATGADLAVGVAPDALGGVFDFLSKASANTSTRLFGNGSRLRIQWCKGMLTPSPSSKVVGQFPAKTL